MNNHKLYFKNLDSIRFLAAIMVFLSHTMGPSFEYLPIENTFWDRLLHVITSGGKGVSIFFVLSGFLITYLLIQEYELTKKISLKNFYIRRVLRIWPLYFLIIAFTFLIYPLLKSVVGLNNPLHSNILYYISFLSNFDVIHVSKCFAGQDALSQNVTWSISIEEQFYVFWPLIFVFLPKKTWLYAVLLVIFGSVAFRVLNHKDAIVSYFHTFSVLLDLGIGGLTALLINNSKKIRLFFEKSSTRFHLAVFTLSFCLMLWEDLIFSFPYGNAISRTFLSISFALIIAGQALTISDSKLNLGRYKFANKWGNYTYGIYLIHPIVITLMNIVVRQIHIPNTNFTFFLIYTVICFIITLFLSKLCYDYYESKFLALKSRFSNN